MKVVTMLRKILGLPPAKETPQEALERVCAKAVTDSAASGEKVRKAAERLEAEAALVRSGRVTAAK